MKVEIKYPKRATDSVRHRKVSVELNVLDTYNLDKTLASVIAPALKKYQKDSVSHPAGLSPKRWKEIIDKMIYSFEKISVDELFDTDKEIDKGLRLFAKYFRQLWY